MKISKLKIPKSTYFLKTVFRKVHYQFTIEVSSVAVEAMSLGNLLFALIKKIVHSLMFLPLSIIALMHESSKFARKAPPILP